MNIQFLDNSSKVLDMQKNQIYYSNKMDADAEHLFFAKSDNYFAAALGWKNGKEIIFNEFLLTIDISAVKTKTIKEAYLLICDNVLFANDYKILEVKINSPEQILNYLESLTN